MALQIFAFTSSTQLASFSGLPTELQLEILRYRLLFQTVLGHRAHTNAVTILLPIALVNKQLKDVAYAVYYGENKFKLTETFRYDTVGITVVFCVPKSVVGQHIRHLELQFVIESEPNGEGWERLLIGNDMTGNSPLKTRWQRNFPSLISIEVLFRNNHSGRRLESELEPFMEWLQTKHILVKAQQVTVKTPFPPSITLHLCEVEFRCKAILEAALKDMMKREREDDVDARVQAVD